MREGWLSGLKEIASHCGISTTTLRKKWLKTMKMPVTKVRGRLYADPKALNKWLNYPHEKTSRKLPK